MKICIYTICLNEIKHCERWAKSGEDADYRIVLDTGSTDGSVEKLRELGVCVYEKKFDNWRFDVARNTALDIIPKDVDVCVSMDMDEFMESGWRNEIEKSWTNNTTQLTYKYVFNYDPNLSQQNSYYADKIHSRNDYEWKRPVHETVFPKNVTPVIACNTNLIMNQIQDTSKNTRQNYLALLELAFKENPNDAQIAFWLGREFMHKNNYRNAIDVLNKFLKIDNIWHIEASESLIYLSRMDNNNALEHLFMAMVKSPARREVWNEISQYFYNKSDWNGLLWASVSGIERSINHGSYLDRKDAWDSRLYDFASLASWNLGWKDKAIEYCKYALNINPTDGRLQNNLKIMEN